MKKNILLLTLACLAAAATGARAQTTYQPTDTSCVGEAGTIQWLIYQNMESSSLNGLRGQPAFPQAPDQTLTLKELATPGNYDDNYAGLLRGYIKAPESGLYSFNLTGDDNSAFFFLQSFAADTMARLASVPGWTGVTEHDKYPEQSSDPTFLAAGQYYYFEVLYKEGRGGDHARVYWKLPSQPNAAWQVIHGSYLYQDACYSFCPPAGTPCNDGNPLTTADQQDGNCNCIGIPDSLPSPAIGPRNMIQALYWDTLPGASLDDLTGPQNSRFPLMPDRAEVLHRFQGPLVSQNQYGSRVRAFLRPPVSGNYTFNLTGNNETQLFISSGISEEAVVSIAFIDGDTEAFEHDAADEPLQTSSPIYLEADSFYYVELLHKENWGGDHFQVFWRTPFASDTLWRIIDGAYLYRYNADLACVPEGTPCDDGDPNTFNDTYDANCNCVGTPCDGPDCTNALDYTPYDACAVTGYHSTSPNDSWLSCTPRQSPNPARGLSHWIQYDLGQPYILNNSQIWNYNVLGESSMGFKDVVLDYSTDGVNWIQLGVFTWPQAPESSAYEGFGFPDLAGISARYILITALDNFGPDPCMGISEVSFSVFNCPNAGTPCDDGRFDTINDTYDENCNCTGVSILDNPCTVPSRTINDDPILSGAYDAGQTITSAGKVAAGTQVFFVAAQEVTLLPGFAADSGSVFTAAIRPCQAAPAENNAAVQTLTANPPVSTATVPTGATWLRLAPNPTRSWSSVDFFIPAREKVRLGVFDLSGKLLQWIILDQHLEPGEYRKLFPAHQLAGGVYLVSLFSGKEIRSERLVVID